MIKSYISWLIPYFSHTDIKARRPTLGGEKITRSSAYIKWFIVVLLTQQPVQHAERAYSKQSFMIITGRHNHHSCPSKRGAGGVHHGGDTVDVAWSAWFHSHKFRFGAGWCPSALVSRCTLASRGSSGSLHSSMRAAFAVVLMVSVHLMKLFRDFRRGTTRDNKGPFKCHVTQMGVGGGGGCPIFRKKALRKVLGVMFNVISVTRGWVGVQFAEK